MANGYKASWKMNQHKDFSGKRIGKMWWFPRGKVTKQKTVSVERMMKKKIIREEWNEALS